FLTVRIPLNQEAEAQKLPRYTHWAGRKDTTKTINGFKVSSKDSMPEKGGIHPMTPVAASGDRPNPGERGRDGAVRFMIDPECADAEKSRVAAYFKVEREEYEV